MPRASVQIAESLRRMGDAPPAESGFAASVGLYMEQVYASTSRFRATSVTHAMQSSVRCVVLHGAWRTLVCT